MQKRGYFEKVVEGYREMAEDGWDGLRWYRINGERPKAAVSESVAEVLEHVFNMHFEL